MKKGNSLNSEDELTTQIKNSGIYTLNELIESVKILPYGRNSKRTDFSLVIKEKKGSCSSKHALIKKIADLNGIPNVKLILGIYKMNLNNTPRIGTVLSDALLTYIPEAHCYINIDGKFIDITTSKSSFKNIENDILQEIEIVPEQVFEYKITYHKAFLKKWIAKNDIKLSFNEVWSLREKCIQNLSR